MQLFAKGRNINNCQSPSDWGSMQDLTEWSSMIMRTVRNQPRTTREDLVNELKAAGTIVTKKQMVTHYSVKDWNPAAPASSPSSRKHMYTCLKFATDSEENWVKVLWSDEAKIQLFGINATLELSRWRNFPCDNFECIIAYTVYMRNSFPNLKKWVCHAFCCVLNLFTAPSMFHAKSLYFLV